jgi:DNA-binding XRE family transcriptional regulator
MKLKDAPVNHAKYKGCRGVWEYLTMTSLNNLERKEVVTELAKGETQSSLASKYGVTQPTIAKIKKEHEYQILSLKTKLINEHCSDYVNRAVLEERKAKNIVSRARIPTRQEHEFLSRLDRKGKQVLDIVSPPSGDINLTQTNIKASIMPQVLKMFQSGSADLSDASNTMPIEAEIVK